ncbi:MAG: hypothetical protein R6U97_01330, partial [Desulfosalsimonas sp.]
MHLRKLILRRSLEILLVFFIILTGLFLLFHLAPGDPVSRMVEPGMTTQDTQMLIAQLGLDKPVWL